MNLPVCRTGSPSGKIRNFGIAESGIKSPAESAAMLRLDPAAASSSLITSVADVAGLIIHFSIAARILPGAR